MTMRQIKKIAFIILIALLTLNSSACTAKVNKNEMISREEKVVIKWMLYGEKAKSSDTIIAQFNGMLQEYYPDTTIEFEFVPKEQYRAKWDMKMATDEPVDMVWIGNDLFNYSDEVKKGSFIALDYLLNTYGTNLLNMIPDNLWSKQQRDNKTYSVPLLGELYRKDYALVTAKSDLAAYGDELEIATINQRSLYTDASCFDPIETYLYNMKAAQKIGTGISCETFFEIANKGYEGIYGPDSPFVIRIFDNQLKVYNKYELNSFYDFFDRMHKWYQKGYIRQDITEVLDPQNDNGPRNGNVVFLDEYGENGVVLDKITTDYEAVRIPLQKYKYISYDSCRNAVAIPRTSTNPARAMEIINLLNLEEGAKMCRLLCNGTEGRHYINRSDNLIDWVTGDDGKPIYKVSPYAVSNVFFNLENSRGEFEQLKKYNENALVSPLEGFELDTRMIVLEMAKIDLIVNEYISELKNGTTEDWENVYDTMIEKMKILGSDKVITEMQRQIDEFQKSKDTFHK